MLAVQMTMVVWCVCSLRRLLVVSTRQPAMRKWKTPDMRALESVFLCAATVLMCAMCRCRRFCPLVAPRELLLPQQPALLSRLFVIQHEMKCSELQSCRVFLSRMPGLFVFMQRSESQIAHLQPLHGELWSCYVLLKIVSFFLLVRLCVLCTIYERTNVRMH